MEALINKNKGGSDGLNFNFSFGFDSSEFSDRTLRLEITADSQENIADCERESKRRRIYHEEETALQISNEKAMEIAKQSPSTLHKPNEKTVEILEESLLSARKTSNEAVLRVRTIQVISVLLAAKSPFFYKLFTNGMRESKQRDVTLRISCSEEEAFMDLLNFIYCGSLNAQSTTMLLDVLMVADKFEVAVCMNHCIGVLQCLPMTIDSASLFLSLPSSVLMADAVQPLIIAAKGFLKKQFSKIKVFKEEHMSLPLAVVEESFTSDELQVNSEDVLYDFIITWAKKHYPNNEERKLFLNNKLSHLIRFPQMTNKKLEEILSSEDFDYLSALKLVSEALLFKAEQNSCTLKGIHDKRFCERSYSRRPIRMMEFYKPHRECMVFWDVKIDELLTSNRKEYLSSEAFYIGDQEFFFLAFMYRCNPRLACIWLAMAHRDKVNTK
ncbi:hypothetical protein KI387_008010, partial [Taxus chinensis]